MKIAPDLTLPPEAVTETFAMLAKRGTGKSNAAVVMAEEMWDAGHQWVAIDPKGDWHGIRSSADGKGEGIPVLIMGGDHGDVPLESTSGALIARLVVERDLTVLLDVSDFSKAEQRRFALEFATTLFRLVKKSPRPLHLFLEEAEEFLPQRVMGEDAKMVGAYSKIAKQGRTHGLGCTLITQRSASLNKDALSQTETLILFKTTSPHDRKAVLAWAEHHEDVGEIAKTLQTLKAGESWVLSPGFLGVTKRIQWRRRRTFDSGATPVVGQRTSAPTSVARVDLDEISMLMAETIEKAKADDPRELRAEISRLQGKIRELEDTPVAVVYEEVKVPTLPDGLWGALQDGLANVMEGQRLVGEGVDGIIDQVVGRIKGLPTTESWERTLPVSEPKREPLQPVEPRTIRTAPVAAGGDKDLSPAERELLVALAQTDDGWGGQDLAVLVGKRYSGGFRNYLASLRTAGYITGSNKGPMTITATGLAALGPYDPLPTGRALFGWWLDGSRLSPAEKDILRVLDRSPGLNGPAVAAAVGKEYSGGFRNYLAKLRTLRLIKGTNTDGMRLSPLLQ